MRYVRSGLCVLGLLLSYAASARAESLTKVGLVLFASHQIVTPATRKDGIGAYDRDRLAANISQVASAFGLARPPTISEIYDERFLPAREERMLIK